MSYSNVLLLIVIVGFVVYLTAVRYRRRGVSERQIEQGEAESGEQELRRTMERLLLELEELSREISGRIDTKMKTLEVLIRQADERIQALEGAMPEGGKSIREAASRYKEIYELADSGTSLEEIASRTGIQSGEVELILSLRRFEQRPSG